MIVTKDWKTHRHVKTDLGFYISIFFITSSIIAVNLANYVIDVSGNNYVLITICLLLFTVPALVELLKAFSLFKFTRSKLDPIFIRSFLKYFVVKYYWFCATHTITFVVMLITSNDFKTYFIVWAIGYTLFSVPMLYNFEHLKSLRLKFYRKYGE